MNKRHGKTAKLTTIRLEQSAASGEVSEARFIVGGGWREKERAGEEKSGKIVAKTMNR